MEFVINEWMNNGLLIDLSKVQVLLGPPTIICKFKYLGLSLFDGGMNTSRINPIGPDRTELLYAFYFSEEAAAGEMLQDEIIERNLVVIEEDFEICNEIHKN